MNCVLAPLVIKTNLLSGTVSPKFLAKDKKVQKRIMGITCEGFMDMRDRWETVLRLKMIPIKVLLLMDDTNFKLEFPLSKTLLHSRCSSNFLKGQRSTTSENNHKT